jgi:hypothetical protein
MKLFVLPAFLDNDHWLLHDGQRALPQDPGDAWPVLDCLHHDGLQLLAILGQAPAPHHDPGHHGQRKNTFR